MNKNEKKYVENVREQLASGVLGKAEVVGALTRLLNSNLDGDVDRYFEFGGELVYKEHLLMELHARAKPINGARTELTFIEALREMERRKWSFDFIEFRGCRLFVFEHRLLSYNLADREEWPFAGAQYDRENGKGTFVQAVEVAISRTRSSR